MARNGVTTVVDKRPLCDLCLSKGKRSEATFDAKTKMGPWAYLCLPCYKEVGMGLGTGLGQRLYLRKEVQ